jgi:CheY-like chemotaxis protein
VYLPAATTGDAVTPQVRPPSVPAAAAEPSLLASGLADDSAPLVLVVEDDVHIATVLRTYLEADGYRVDIVPDGQQAIEAARRLSPFAITLDISLPKLDGWSVLNALKREAATTDIPVVIVSIVDNRDFGLVLGASDYLVKPIDHERLRTVLRSLNSIRAPGDGTVLVVDDDPALRDVLSSLLAEDGWHVATAADGEAALAAIDHARPTAMVLDLMMPRCDGFEVLRALRTRPATRDLPVIVITAKELSDDDRARLARNAERVFQKQAVPLEQLRQEIRGILTERRSRGESSVRGDGQL